MDNQRRVALVTGGVGGIGTAICKRLAQDGHFVVANYAIPGTEDRWRQSMAASSLNGVRAWARRFAHGRNPATAAVGAEQMADVGVYCCLGSAALIIAAV